MAVKAAHAVRRLSWLIRSAVRSDTEQARACGAARHGSSRAGEPQTQFDSFDNVRCHVSIDKTTHLRDSCS
eukprot:5018903-Prymnesium_polylepis.2